jgi:hypothetical protein
VNEASEWLEVVSCDLISLNLTSRDSGRPKRSGGNANGDAKVVETRSKRRHNVETKTSGILALTVVERELLVHPNVAHSKETNCRHPVHRLVPERSNVDLLLMVKLWKCGA